MLRDVYGVRLGRAVEYIDPGVADRHIVRHLGVTPTTPVFRIERSTYTIDNRLAEYRRASLRGDLYRYRIELR